jgi:gas vesicle protein
MKGEKGKGLLIGLIIGAIVGAIAALLLAPKSGKETRDRLKRVVGIGKEQGTERDRAANGRR